MTRALQVTTGTLPAFVGGVALTVSGVSTYWDIASHVDGGRERFLTPPHVGIYSGVTIALIVIGLAMLGDRLGAGASLRDVLIHPFRNLTPGLAAAGSGMATALAAAPLDNAWHEIYGIDITIWSPPHLLAIFGVSGAALGLAMLVAPATGQHRPLLHHFLLSAFLAGLLVTTGEFDFNGPQYRIAYHPMILAAAATLVLVAGSRGPHRWAATRIAVMFELARLGSLVLLMGLGHSLAFVPLLVPTALVVDLLRDRIRRRPLFAGAALGVVTVAANAPLLELLGGVVWRGDDLLLGVLGAVVASSVTTLAGVRLGDALVGDAVNSRSERARPGAAALIALLALMLIPSSAAAHEVGGEAGEGLISWSPASVAPQERVEVRIAELELASSGEPDGVRLEAWRAEHRIQVPLTTTSAGYRGSFAVPDEGPWMLLIRIQAGDQRLLGTRQLDVGDGHTGSFGGTHSERFTLGLDTLAASDPPPLLDAGAYGVSLAILLLLLRGLLRSLGRLRSEDAVMHRGPGPVAL